MQVKEKCKKCTKAFPIGVDNLGHSIMGCKNIICIFEPIIENPFHYICLGEF